jgi:tRNA/tmRNA/rRNA uracil-C5-methylase (TrmA/RlmC/RlmD family)
MRSCSIHRIEFNSCGAVQRARKLREQYDIQRFFSVHAQAYAETRPSYPDELFEFLNSQCEHHDLVWDCATGNGQAAVSLAKIFKRVIATDASAEQVKHAQPTENIEYRQMMAERLLHEKTPAT